MTPPVWTPQQTDHPQWLVSIDDGEHPALDPRRPIVPILAVPDVEGWAEGADYTFEPPEDGPRWYDGAPRAWRETILDGGLVALRGDDRWGGVWEIDTSHINPSRLFLRTGRKVADLAGEASGLADKGPSA